jgi:hypothetical protein
MNGQRWKQISTANPVYWFAAKSANQDVLGIVIHNRALNFDGSLSKEDVEDLMAEDPKVSNGRLVHSGINSESLHGFKQVLHEMTN